MENMVFGHVLSNDTIWLDHGYISPEKYLGIKFKQRQTGRQTDNDFLVVPGYFVMKIFLIKL